MANYLKNKTKMTLTANIISTYRLYAIVLLAANLCLTNTNAQAQNSRPIPSKPRVVRPIPNKPTVVEQENDTLSIVLRLIHIEPDSTLQTQNAKPPNLTTDSLTKQAYYELCDTLNVGSQLQIVIEKIPKIGYLYLFSLDAQQNVKILWNGSTDSLKQQYPNGILPDTTHAYYFEHPGTEHICLWYSQLPITKYEQLIYGMEMTNGTFMERTKMQLNQKITQPNDLNYLLMPQKIAAIVPNKTKQNNNDKVLPIVVACIVKKTNIPNTPNTPNNNK